jgi:glycosyltransferase involved in cell wall biosynthesis
VVAFPAQIQLKWAEVRTWINLIRQQRVQVIHAHQGRDYWPAILAARLAGCGTHVFVTRHLMTRPRAFSRWFLLRMADVVAVSRAAEGVLQRELRGPKRRLHQVYGGVDTTQFYPERTPTGRSFRENHGWSEEAVVFAVVGAYNLPRGKGQLEFLEAAARLRLDFPHARFALVGAGNMAEVLRQRMAELNLNRVAAMISFADDISLVMNALDVLVHPALGTEALGLVLLEALASSKPVIASRLDGIPEAFHEGEHGLLVPPLDVSALAAAMRTLLVNPELCKQFGRAGRTHVCQNFSRPHFAVRMQRLYLEIT